MPRIGFKTENKTSTSGPQIPRLKLKAGEKARIMIGLEDPEMQFVHTLRKPVVEDGKAVLEKDQRSDAMKIVKDFVSRPLCLGDYETVEKKGTDPENCVYCALAKENKDFAEAPEMRFAVNVFKYRTQPGSFNVANPFGGEIVVWSFPQSKFNKIIDIAEEFGDLRNHDLILGPCENEGWQKFDINAASKAVWRESDENRKFLAQSFKENRIEDLALACGQRKEPRWVEKDIQDIRDAWASITGSATASPANDGSLDTDLNSLMEQGATKEEAWATPDELAAALENELPTAKPASTPVEKQTVEAAEPVSIEDLAADLIDTPTADAAEEGDPDEDGMSDLDFDSLMADLEK